LKRGSNLLLQLTLKEDTFYLEKYNKQLLIDKEKNIHIAILTERNRIARELHDSIGHAISSSILQVEALKVISTEEPVIKNLDILQNTLKSGMDNIRKSIHNLYNESLDLKSQIEKLCSETPTVDVELVYKFDEEINYDFKFDILSVVKEALTNCAKHSNATKIKISLLNQPKFYSILIEDNGSNFDEKSKGIGLLSMNEIAEKYNGYFNCKFEDGFKIHMTLMKG
jgi:signal transduction histidine kinase